MNKPEVIRKGEASTPNGTRILAYEVVGKPGEIWLLLTRKQE